MVELIAHIVARASLLTWWRWPSDFWRGVIGVLSNSRRVEDYHYKG